MKDMKDMKDMTDNWETSLPESLQNAADKSKIKDVTMQWSRLIAWSWTPLLAFKENSTKELLLKKFFNKTLQGQALKTIAYEAYDEDNSKNEANLLSEYIQAMLIGKNEDVPYLQQMEIKVTLADVLKALSGEEFVFTKYPDFAKMFTCRVTPEYVPQITEIGERQYVALLAYPPRPDFNEYTVTEQQVYNWALNINTGGDYLPPSVYIPIAGS